MYWRLKHNHLFLGLSKCENLFATFHIKVLIAKKEILQNEYIHPKVTFEQP